MITKEMLDDAYKAVGRIIEEDKEATCIDEEADMADAICDLVYLFRRKYKVRSCSYISAELRIIKKQESEHKY